MPANPFFPEMTHFALALHATREELVALAAGWAREHDLHASIEHFFPEYLVAAVPAGGDLEAAIAQFEPVRRIGLRRTPFDIVAVTQDEHVAMNPETLVMVLEPVTEDGLRATAMTARMGDLDALRWWVGLARDASAGMHRGAWATGPDGARRQYVDDHWHTTGAHDLAAEGVPMLAAAGTAIFEFDDLA